MILYSATEKIWSRDTDPKKDVVPMGSYLGTAILEKMKAFDPERVAEYNHDTNESITFRNVHDRTITIAANLMKLGADERDIIALYTRHNSYTSSIAFGCYLNGTPWCPFDIFDGMCIL